MLAQAVSFANIEDIGVLNLSTREHAPDVRLNPDGSFTYDPLSSASLQSLVGDSCRSFS